MCIRRIGYNPEIMKSTDKTYYIQTYGCQMNIFESEKIAGLLEGLGLSLVKTIKDLPDVVVINSCSVRQAAEDSVYGLANRIALARNQKPEIKVFLTGCLTGSVKGERQRLTEKSLRQRVPWVDYLVETEKYHEIGKIISNVGLVNNRLSILDSHNNIKRNSKTHAYVTISTGCDNFCSYCVVPYSRKAEKSFSKNQILKEVNDLVRLGYTDITLLGQNVNSWGIESKSERVKIRANSEQKLPFAALLRELHEIDNLKNISFMSSNPFDFTLDLVDAMKLPKIDKYLHIAVQSGSNEILRRMNRRHTREEFLELIENLRKNIPGIKISTDLIVGFPEETEEQFMETVDLCQKVHFQKAYISIYSSRPGTNAAKFFIDNVPTSIKKRRHAKLMEVIKTNKTDA
jgi:tRNA-2-methylthio-N6-dimethylallyladenosine synthase